MEVSDMVAGRTYRLVHRAVLGEAKGRVREMCGRLIEFRYPDKPHHYALMKVRQFAGAYIIPVSSIEAVEEADGGHYEPRAIGERLEVWRPRDPEADALDDARDVMSDMGVVSSVVPAKLYDYMLERKMKP